MYSARETTWTSQPLWRYSNCFCEHLPTSHPPLRAVLTDPLRDVDLSGLASCVVALIFACFAFAFCVVALILAWFCFLYCCCHARLVLLPVLLLSYVPGFASCIVALILAWFCSAQPERSPTQTQTEEG